MVNFIKPGQHGFRMHFSNGLALSIQYGKGNYCENRDYSPDSWNCKHEDLPMTSTVEIAVLKGDELLPLVGDTVYGWLPVEALPSIMGLLRYITDPAQALAAVVSVLSKLKGPY